MTKSPSPTPPSTPVLSRRQLTWMLVVVTLAPFLLVVGLYFSIPTFEDPRLRAEVELGPRPWPNDTAPDARLVLCVIVRNPTNESWRNVNMSINGQYHYYHPSVLGPGEALVVPMTFFHTKGSTVYHPENWPLERLTLYAQLPNGARAILELDREELGEARASLPAVDAKPPQAEVHGGAAG